MTIALVSHSHKQGSKPTQAAELFTSHYFKLKRAYVEKQQWPWVVLSPAKGILPAAIKVAPYDWTQFSFDEHAPFWAPAFAKLQAEYPHVGRVIVLGGAHYVDLVTSHYKSLNVKVVAPLAGLRIGEKMQWLKAHT